MIKQYLFYFPAFLWFNDVIHGHPFKDLDEIDQLRHFLQYPIHRIVYPIYKMQLATTIEKPASKPIPKGNENNSKKETDNANG